MGDLNRVPPLSSEALDQLTAVLEQYYEPSGPEASLKRVCELLGGTAEDSDKVRAYLDCSYEWKDYTRQTPDPHPLVPFLQRPDVQLAHVVRLLFLVDAMSSHQQLGGVFSHDSADELLGYYRKHHPGIGLNDVASALATLGVSKDRVGWLRLEWWDPSFVWEDEAVWPYFAERIHILEEALGLRPWQRHVWSWEKTRYRSRAWEVLAAFPEPPESLVPFVWDIVLGSAKSEKPQAMRLLEKLPDTQEKLVEALKSGKQDARASAAAWLAQFEMKETIPLIQAALKKEKQETARTAMMVALESFGLPLEDYLDLNGLTAGAKKALEKGIPESLLWFRFDDLPAVHWEDSGAEVPKDVVKWWIVHNNKLNSPEPGPLLRRYCSLLRKDDREALSQFILSSWIAEDTIPVHSYEEALALAKRDAQQTAQFYAQLNWQYSLESLERRYVNSYLSVCQRSAIKEKGILAVAAACAGPQAASTVGAYLNRWYGLRAAQCKALVRMLSWVDDPGAIQLLLTTSVRFRTKGIREEAEACVNALAERKGWTVDELADRTIPSAGFDEKGEILLEYGTRSFTARLDQDFKIALFNENGESIKSLPEARKDDDEEKAKESKYLLSYAKDQLKTVVKAQKDRLYEAMCTQRTWRYEDWDTYLRTHPIVGRYCQSLVWKASQEGSEDVLFRPLDDGTLSDHRDNEAEIAPDAVIRLAHGSTTSEADAKAWMKHLKDYEVTPLFGQFAKPAYALPEEKKGQTELTDFQGHMIDSLKLRSASGKLGYVRGEVEDGPYFFEYRKQFPGLKIEAVINFSGSQLPETSRPVALISLSFRRTSQEEQQGRYRQSPAVKLGEIPEVLLSECWNDVRIIAGQGTGYDAGWEEKVDI